MDYMGWILSIYDEYERIYYDKHPIRKVKNFNEFINNCFKKQNRYISIWLMLFFLNIVTILILYFLGKLDNKQYYIVIPFIALFIGIIPQWYQNELNLKEYEEKLLILMLVLKEHNLYNSDIIKILLKETRGVFYKIKRAIIGALGIIISSGILKLFIDNSEEWVTISNNIFVIIIIVVYLIIFLFIVWYNVASSIPNSRIIRKRKMHELLRILVIYKFKSDQFNDYESLSKLELIKNKVIEKN